MFIDLGESWVYRSGDIIRKVFPGWQNIVFRKIWPDRLQQFEIIISLGVYTSGGTSSIPYSMYIFVDESGYITSCSMSRWWFQRSCFFFFD